MKNIDKVKMKMKKNKKGLLMFGILLVIVNLLFNAIDAHSNQKQFEKVVKQGILINGE